MPELAEVEWFRRQWNPGRGAVVLKVELHADKRIFRETNTRDLAKRLTGAKFLVSSARGKRMLFKFSDENWLGVHLGMSGHLRVEPSDFTPGKHDHLVLKQDKRSLVFRDARQFGRVRFHHGKQAPDWWSGAVPEISSAKFNQNFLDDFLRRHGKAPIKAVILMQEGFSGIGNWMADEILWRAKIKPSRRAGRLTASEKERLLRETRFVSKKSLEIVGRKNGDLPHGWLMHERWGTKGKCPIHKTSLRYDTIGGRTTAWCSKCQR